MYVDLQGPPTNMRSTRIHYKPQHSSTLQTGPAVEYQHFAAAVDPWEDTN